MLTAYFGNRIIHCSYEGTKAYHEDKLLHRENLPCVVNDYYGEYEWRLKGKLHRLDGPAVEGFRTAWYINGRKRASKTEPYEIYRNGNATYYFKRRAFRCKEKFLKFVFRYVEKRQAKGLR